jgi:c-di-GMP-binding flagellar brake protein YcgR
MNGLAIEGERLTMTAPSAVAERSDVVVRSRQEIVRLLTGVMTEGALLSIHFPDAKQVVVSTLIYLDEPNSMLLLECPPEWRDIMVSGADSMVLACAHDDSAIRFQCGKATIVDLQGVPAAAVEIPDFLWRFQRRCEPRHPAQGLTITLNLGFIECDAQVTDLGMSGIGAFTCDAEVQLERGEILRECAIALPGVGVIKVDLTVQHQTPVPTAGGSGMTRVGCQFIDLSEGVRLLIAHYLDALADS